MFDDVADAFLVREVSFYCVFQKQPVGNPLKTVLKIPQKFTLKKKRHYIKTKYHDAAFIFYPELVICN